MSRLGRKPIKIPQGAEVQIQGQKITVSGPKGTLARKLHEEIGVEKKDNLLVFSIKKDSPRAKTFWGLERVLVENMLKGVMEGFEKKLEMHGVGFRAKKEKENLVLSLGFSHPVVFKKPEDVEFKIEKNVITVFGCDKQRVGEVAAQIRSLRPPEPYKGKGIRYVGEYVRRKAGKAATGVTGGEAAK